MQCQPTLRWSAMAFKLSLYLIRLSFIIPQIAVKSQGSCLQTNSERGLPFFIGYTGDAGLPERRIQNQHQAIIPSYKLNCCGNITAWGVDLNPAEEGVWFNFSFQVWRPSPTVSETGCYSLVDNYVITTSIATRPESEHVARVTPSPQYQLQFQPGDVLGFYVENNSSNTPDDNGVVLLNNGSHSSEEVWFEKITVAQNSPSGTCPYPVGPSRFLNSSTNAAPVISISTIAYPCPRSSPTLTLQATATPTPDPTYNSTPQLPQQSPTPPGFISDGVNIGLIAGPVIAVLVMCVSTLVIIIAIVATVKKRRTMEKTFDTAHSGMALSNQVYGVPQKGQLDVSYKYPDSSPKCKPPISVRYAANGPDVRADAFDKETPFANDNEGGATYSEAVLYHSVDPDISKTGAGIGAHVYVDDPLNHVYQYAEAGLEEQTRRKATEAVAYEVPGEELFVTAGLYVPTAEERSNWGGHYNMQDPNINPYNELEFFKEEQIYWAPASTTTDLYSQLASKKYREISRDQIKTLKALGSGEFGDVCQALWSISGTTKEMAVKTLKPGSSESDEVRFLQEAAIMGQFNHPYVVKLFGVVTVGDPIMICIELMASGDLRGYLGTIVPESKELKMQLLRFSKQIASGMVYLSKKAFVHRDLAARNVLLDKSLNCKISDFGMARDLVDDTYYTVKSKGGKIPIKWTAPEALFYKKYSTDSDVWSYGMVLFEVWSVGRKPFSQISNNEVLKKVNSGYCQPPPPGCPRAIYKLMISCWNPVHSKRPSFSKIFSTLNASSNTSLQWTEDDFNVSPRAGELGAPLSEAELLYQDLQNTYLYRQRHK